MILLGTQPVWLWLLIPALFVGFFGHITVGAPLRLGPSRGDHHRDLNDAELPGSEHPGVARDQAAVLAHQRRRRPPPTP